MADFSVFIREAAPPGSGLRPFVCDGAPLECEVALVGYNPATDMKAGFWEFWNGQVFDKVRWFEAYKQERREKPLKPGKIRRNEVSPTRKRIDLFVKGLAPYHCIETNLYWDASEDRASHVVTASPRIGALLSLLPALKLVVCHDDEAFILLSKSHLSARLERVAHFANRKPGWSDAAAFELGRGFRNLLAA